MMQSGPSNGPTWFEGLSQVPYLSRSSTQKSITKAVLLQYIPITRRVQSVPFGEVKEDNDKMVRDNGG